MSKGIIGFIIGLIAVLGGAFVATMLLKNKLAQKDEDDFSDFDSFDDPIDDEEFESFFGDDDLPDDVAVIPETVDDEDDKEEQL
ncbi:MAG: hypothetical protein J1F60_04660 [Oscillospiraceae bacterium]|nr:hypothetical protein [Oscillospiraceae bacterium]